MKVAGSIHLKRHVLQVVLVCLCLMAGADRTLAGGDPLSGHPRGIKLGFGLSSMYGEARDSVDVYPSLTPTAGMFVVFPFSKRLEVQPELLLTIKGVKQEFTAPLMSGSMAFSETGYLLYAQFPVLVKFPFPSSGVRRTSVYVGPYGAFNLWSHTSGDYAVEDVPSISDGSFSGSIGNIHRLDFGIVGGFDHRFNWGGRTVVLDLRYTHGLRQVFYNLENPNDVAEGDLPYVYSYSDRGKEFRDTTLTLTLSLLLKP